MARLVLLTLLCRSSPVSAQLPVVPAIDSLYDTMCVLTVSSWSRRHADVQRGSQLFFRRYALIIDQASLSSANELVGYHRQTLTRRTAMIRARASPTFRTWEGYVI